jgi:hypothetical protein
LLKNDSLFDHVLPKFLDIITLPIQSVGDLLLSESTLFPYFPIPTSHPVASTGASGVQEPQTTLLGGSVPSGGKGEGVFVVYKCL